MPFKQNKTFKHEFVSEDGTKESMTFRWPTTTERLDTLEMYSEVYGSLEEADKEPDRRSIKWRRIVDHYLELGQKLLIDTDIVVAPENATDCQKVGVVRGFENWQKLLADDIAYGQEIANGLAEFFRQHLTTKPSGEAGGSAN